mgnify:CR=1 FL=1
MGDRVGIFRIRHLSDTEVVMGQDDKHLDVQVSICKRGGSGAQPTVVLSTVVHIHNTLGHAYMTVITPIHRVIARDTAQRLADHRADGQVGHVVVVHHVEVDDVGAGGEDLVDFLTQAGEIGGEDRRSDGEGLHGGLRRESERRDCSLSRGAGQLSYVS